MAAHPDTPPAVAGFSLRELLRSAILPFRDRAEKQGATLRWSVSPLVHDCLEGNKRRLTETLAQIMDQIVVCVEASREPGGDVTVGVKLAEPGPPVKLLFSLRGRGGCAALTETRDELSHKVQEMGGTLWIESEGNGDAAAYFTALFQPANDPSLSPSHAGPSHAQAAQASAAAAGASLSRLPRLSILLAEDNMINQLYLKTYLTEAGHSVVTASNGKEALRRAGEGDFDLVIMDISMPEMDGLTACRTMRDLNLLADNGSLVPVLALSAHSDEEDVARCVEAGMNGHLAKPFTLEELAEAIDHLIPSDS